MSARNKGKKKAQGADDEPEKGARGRKMTPEKAILDEGLRTVVTELKKTLEFDTLAFWDEVVVKLSKLISKCPNAGDCRRRWFDYSDPEICREPLTEDECRLIKKLAGEHRKWVEITAEVSETFGKKRSLPQVTNMFYRKAGNKYTSSNAPSSNAPLPRRVASKRKTDEDTDSGSDDEGDYDSIDGSDSKPVKKAKKVAVKKDSPKKKKAKAAPVKGDEEDPSWEGRSVSKKEDEGAASDDTDDEQDKRRPLKKRARKPTQRALDASDMGLYESDEEEPEPVAKPVKINPKQAPKPVPASLKQRGRPPKSPDPVKAEAKSPGKRAAAAATAVAVAAQEEITSPLATSKKGKLAAEPEQAAAKRGRSPVTPKTGKKEERATPPPKKRAKKEERDDDDDNSITQEDRVLMDWSTSLGGLVTIKNAEYFKKTFGQEFPGSSIKTAQDILERLRTLKLMKDIFSSPRRRSSGAPQLKKTAATSSTNDNANNKKRKSREEDVEVPKKGGDLRKMEPKKKVTKQ